MTASLAELSKLAQSIDTDTKALAERINKHDAAVARERQNLSERAQKFAALAAAAGATTARVLAQKPAGASTVAPVTPTAPARQAKARKRNRKAKGAPKYRDPEIGKTWTGMGTVPDWIKGSGKDKSAFLISA